MREVRGDAAGRGGGAVAGAGVPSRMVTSGMTAATAGLAASRALSPADTVAANELTTWIGLDPGGCTARSSFMSGACEAAATPA